MALRLVGLQSESGSTGASVAPISSAGARSIARPDGSFEVLEQPTSYEDIARFADRATRVEMPSAAPELSRSSELAAPRSNP